MGQNNAKTQSTSNLRKSLSRNTGARPLVQRESSSPDQQPSLDDTITAKTQTGNLIISIHMLTMNNSNEVNSNSCRSIAAAADNCVNISTTAEISAACSKQTIDQYNNDKQQQHSEKMNGVNASTSACKKFCSKYNKATLVSKSSPASSSSQHESNSVAATCDNQSNSNNNNSVNNNEISNSATPATSTNNFRLSSCLSTMLGSKCKFGSSSNSSTIVPVSSSATTAKVRKGILGKFKSNSKQKSKSRDEKMVAEDANSSLNTSNTSSSSNGSDKTDTTCTHCTASTHRASDETATRQFPAGHTTATETMSLTYNPNNSVLLPTNTSISITSGGSATTGSNATAIILPDSALLHSNGFPTTAALYGSLNNTSGGNFILVSSLFDMTRLSDDSLEDCDEQARLRRARQIAEGVEAPPGFVPSTASTTASNLQNSHLQTLLCSIDPLHNALRNQLFKQQHPLLFGEEYPRVHSQADYIHCLVPDLKKITSCCFYWGKMDRYEAEKLLDGKPEGTFLLRDSAQEEFLFSVSFRKYGRSLHARIEQFNHQFSFDSHDPGVYTATTVTGLLEHYKDPSCVMFFEPMLTLPLNRNFVFSLQELSRATIVSHTTYDGIDQLSVPKMLKSYLKEYHYKQRVHVKRLDEYHDT